MKYFRYLLLSTFAIVLTTVLSGCENNMVVFNPEGPVARSILELINFSIVMMLIVVVFVFGLFGFIVWKYRERPENKDYEPPEEEGNHKLEIIWTVIPILIVTALTIPTVMTTYKIENVPEGYEKEEPLVVHVTSADWKWIFSYPEQNIETVNYLNIPADTPVLFKMTSAGTMQSFWVPALGGQKYTMANMETKMYLVADRPGSYLGRNTNFNGQGYAHMEFEVESKSPEDFNKWIKEVKETAPALTKEQYTKLLYPGLVGRMTFNGTHLQWIDHSDPNTQQYLNPDAYRIHHGDHEEQDSHDEVEVFEGLNKNEDNENNVGGDEHGSHGH